MNWAKRAIAIADRKGVSQTEIGKVVGRNRGWIGKIASGENSARVEDALKVAEYLDVSLDYLFRDEMPWVKPHVRAGVGDDWDADAVTLIRLVKALGLSPDEAIRRIAAADEPLRVVAVRRVGPPTSDAPDPKPPDGGLDDDPPGVGGRVQGRRRK